LIASQPARFPSRYGAPANAIFKLFFRNKFDRKKLDPTKFGQNHSKEHALMMFLAKTARTARITVPSFQSKASLYRENLELNSKPFSKRALQK
jgi:hypothetical protein